MSNHKIIKLLISHFTFPQYSYYLYWNYLYELYNLYLSLETSLEMDRNIEYPNLEGTHKNQGLTPDSTQGKLELNHTSQSMGQMLLEQDFCSDHFPGELVSVPDHLANNIINSYRLHSAP